MRKFLLIASVAAMAVTAPAKGEREGRKGEQQRIERGEQRAERAQARESRAQARPQRTERAQVGPRRAERASQAQFQARERQQARTQRVEQAQSDRRSRLDQAQTDRRSQRQQQASDRRSRIEQAQSDRRSQHQQHLSDRRSRIEQAQSDRRSQRQQIESDRRSRLQQAQSDSRSRFQQVDSDRASALRDAEPDRRSRIQLEADRRAFNGDESQWRQQLWERRAQRENALAELRQRRMARWTQESDDRRVRSDFFRVGERVDRNWWYDGYVPLRYRASFYDNDRYYYRYDGDYLYRLSRDDDVVLSLFPLLGGAYSVGRPLPFYYDSFYNVPLGYSTFYYDTPDYYYRYGGGAIYQVDPTTQLIAGIVALLTGQNLGIGQMLPLGYDVYNVPYAYRSSYYDTPDMWWRYDDGYLYGVDPYTRMIERRVPVYGGYLVGNPWPSYAGYGYDVPYGYDDLYYAAPGYDYRYASGSIYQVDPATQLIASLAALVTGQNFNVGQRLPLGYDVYNVPFAYRGQYYDTDDYMYRYADGRILQVDPGTRVIRRVILV